MVLPQNEFMDNIKQSILSGLYTAAYEKCNKAFDGLFNSLNNRVSDAANTLSKSPEAWNASAYSIVKNLAENAFLPVAAVFMVVVFCWELCQIMQNTNSGMQNFRPQNLIFPLLKLGICLYACSKSFDIVLSFYKLGQKVTSNIGSTSVGTFGEGLEFSSLLEPTLERYELGDVFTLVGYMIILWLGRLVVFIISTYIYIMVIKWFLEIYIFASAAPVPYATWMNKEWSQIAMNYTRKMLALMFQGPFMLLLYAIYGGVLSSVPIGTDFTESMIMIIGVGVALAMLMSKTGSISESIFSAH